LGVLSPPQLQKFSNAIGVDFTTHVFNRVVNHFVLKLVQSLVGFQGIGEHRELLFAVQTLPHETRGAESGEELDAG
jgi:hypothetical protein